MATMLAPTTAATKVTATPTVVMTYASLRSRRPRTKRKARTASQRTKYAMEPERAEYFMKKAPPMREK
jgi:hypothetical protein